MTRKLALCWESIEDGGSLETKKEIGLVAFDVLRFNAL